MKTFMKLKRAVEIDFVINHLLEIIKGVQEDTILIMLQFYKKGKNYADSYRCK